MKFETLRAKGIAFIMAPAMTAMIGFSGCGGVDNERLAQLTGDKNFEQVKEAYKTAILREQPEDATVYKYYLTKNEDKVVGFDFDLYQQKVKNDHKELVTKLDTALKKFEENLDKVSHQTLQNELRTGGFMMGQAKAIDVYVQKIEALINTKREREAAAKKAKKAAREAEIRANESDSDRRYRLNKEYFKNGGDKK